MLIDLQLHSTYSDGGLSPTAVAEFIAARGVKTASLTDHNTIGGQEEFRQACKKYGIKAITGLELYARLNGKKFNILWYNFDDNNAELHKILRQSQIRRRENARAVLKKAVEKSNLKADVNKIIDKYNHYVPINRLARDLLHLPADRKKIAKKLGKNMREGDIIREFFKNKLCGVLNETYINIRHIIKLRKKIGGQLILNHPAKYGPVNADFLKKLKKIGLNGLEILSPHHSIDAVMHLQFWAQRLDMITTGGSDFHRFEGNKALIQNSWEYYKIDSSRLRKVKKIIGE